MHVIYGTNFNKTVNVLYAVDGSVLVIIPLKLNENISGYRCQTIIVIL